MRTFARSYRDDNVLIGFLALVAGAVAIRAANPVVAVIAAAIALALVGFGVWLNRQPKWELRISSDEIVLASKRGVTARIGRVEAGGRVSVLKRIVQGRAWSSLVAPAWPESPAIPLEGFRVPHDALAAACTATGWELVP